MKRQVLLITLALLVMLPSLAQQKKSPSFDEVITSRRSIRSYDAKKKISEAEVRKLLTAVQDAPSWANQQPTKYYVAITPERPSGHAISQLSALFATLSVQDVSVHLVC